MIAFARFCLVQDRYRDFLLWRFLSSKTEAGYLIVDLVLDILFIVAK